MIPLHPAVLLSGQEYRSHLDAERMNGRVWDYFEFAQADHEFWGSSFSSFCKGLLATPVRLT
jgi:hypothetical protein